MAYIETGKTGGTQGTSITPSNTTPVALVKGNDYHIEGHGGYAITSYSSVTPTASGVQFSAGFYKMSTGGYAYAQRPGLIQTELWSNPNETADFGASTVNLTKDGEPKSMRNYDYLKVVWKYHKNATSDTDLYSVLIPVTDFIRSGVQTTSTDVAKYLIGSRIGSGFRGRAVTYATDTSVQFTDDLRLNSSGTDMANSVPVKIYGVLFS